ncbi:MAG: hypothetical protein D6701_01395 [Gemmatimonadetes bacterium]|nr:MAG: hypothetical protein D6701_01395 [Gemmatimonadota bacterium]
MIALEKMQRRVRFRRRMLLGGWLLVGLVIVARSAQVQVLQATEWRALAAQQQQGSATVVAPRGAIVDRGGVELALTREVFELAVAPGEIRPAERDRVERAVAEATGLSLREVRRATRSQRAWRVLPGRYPPRTREALRGLRGVHAARELRRHYPHRDLALGLLGRVLDGHGRGGVEQAYDTLLAGRPGREIFARDNRGRPIPGETVVVEPPRPGGTVVLTIDRDMQEIAQQALVEAVEANEAEGGDLVLLDPHTGDILALVSVRDGHPGALSAINTPYEPGSTMKPFTVAALLELGLASLEDRVDTEDGSWQVMDRTLHDVGEHERVLTVAEALRYSSNVGIAKVAQALSPSQQYQMMRDFGFGAPTGIGLPGESSGVLRRPDAWSGQSGHSLAIGYEVSVTPLQMALAYGALANGGRLMAPRLVREVRDAEGRVVERIAPATVRRVVSADVARRVGRALIDVVEEGTGTHARLAAYRLAGKSGTARAVGVDGRYERGAYHASFAGFFPAEDPQLVILVKLDRPKGAYYGGSTAAPVTRATLEAILAARNSPLDRLAIARSARGPARGGRDGVARRFVRFAALERPVPALPPIESDPALSDRVPVPVLEGLSPRAAVRRLHALGFRVVLEGDGEEVRTEPAAGVWLARGDTVRLLTGRRRGDG